MDKKIGLGRLILSEDGKTILGVTDNTITNIVIPEGVEEIGKLAFQNIHTIKSVQLPNSLKKIGNQAFAATGLVALRIPEGVKEIGLAAFFNSRSLRSISIPSTMERMIDPFTAVILNEVFIYVTDLEKLEFRAPQFNCDYLYVPSGMLEAYRKHPVFGKCKHIREYMIHDIEKKSEAYSNFADLYEKGNRELSDNASRMVREFVVEKGCNIDYSAAISKMCTDNHHSCDNWAYEWAESLVNAFSHYDLTVRDFVIDVRSKFDDKILEWRNNGIIAKDYDVEPVFTGVVSLIISIISREIKERLGLVRDHHYFESRLLKKTKIVALHHYDDTTLNDFSKKYDSYEVAALLDYVSEKYGLSNNEITRLYNDVKSIVYAHPEKKLKEIKKDVERSASSIKEICIYAFLFACAVMESKR